jgi:tetratricopeptide (TPR) repeat protein
VEHPGESPNALAERIRSCCGHPPLKAHRLAKGWTVEKAVESLHEMCAQEDLGARGLTVRSWMEWENQHLPSADYQDLLCRLFQTGPVQLGFARSYTPRGETVPAPIDQRAFVSDVARESLTHAAATQLTEVSPVALEHADNEVRRIAREYVYGEPVPLFHQMLQLRARIFTLLEGRMHPAQASQLLLSAGQVCGLMANASLDLGSPSAACTQAKAAWTYASIIDHDPLRAWVRGLQAMIAYWTGSPDAAVQLARDGQRYAPGATAFARLASIEALASAAVGLKPDALAALDRAWDHKNIYDEIHDDIGGEFGFNRAKHSYLAASTHIHLRRPDQAIAFAERAIRLYQSGPPNLRAYGNEAIAHADLAVGHLLNGDLGAAVGVMTNVLDLPEHQRIDGIAQRLDSVRRKVAGEPRFRGSPQARALVECIEQFRPPSLPRELPR